MSTNPFDDENGTLRRVGRTTKTSTACGRRSPTVPAGWHKVFGEAGRAECLAYVEENWTDMRPRSLRESMDS